VEGVVNIIGDLGAIGEGCTVKMPADGKLILDLLVNAASVDERIFAAGSLQISPNEISLIEICLPEVGPL
jgi:hypothetical protein